MAAPSTRSVRQARWCRSGVVLRECRCERKARAVTGMDVGGGRQVLQHGECLIGQLRVLVTTGVFRSGPPMQGVSGQHRADRRDVQ